MYAQISRHSCTELGLNVVCVVSFFCLAAVPNAWQDAASYTSHIDSEDDEVNPDDEGDAEDELDAKIDTSQDSISPSQILPTQHPHVYKTFLRFLELGCGGSPVQGYPTLVVILSTIPHSVRFLLSL